MKSSNHVQHMHRIAISIFLILLLKPCKSIELDGSSRTEDIGQTFIPSADGTYDVIVKAKRTGTASISSFFRQQRFQMNIRDIEYMALKLTKEELDSLMKTPGVLRVEPDHEVTTFESFENATERKLAESSPWSTSMVLQNVNFFKSTIPSGSVRVCVADTGYTLGHEDLPSGSDVMGRDGQGERWSYDGNGHGTHCAGTIAAKGGNGRGSYGVIPQNYGGRFKLLIAKAFGKAGSGQTSGVLAAVKDCVDQGANVISLSLGCTGCYSDTVNELYQDYYNQNIIIVAAAGNEGNGKLAYPASYPSVISVASIDSSKRRSSFSQYNSQVEISAPGSSIYSTYQSSYGYLSGTSMATPHVAGVFGLLRMHFPNCNAKDLRMAVMYTASALSSNCGSSYGFGLVQALNAYNLLNQGNCGSLEGSPNGGCYNIKQATNPPTKKPTKKPSKKPTKKPQKPKQRLMEKRQKKKKNRQKRKKNRQKRKKNRQKKKKSAKKPKATKSPTKLPTDEPSKSPTELPTDEPTGHPTDEPTRSPTTSSFPSDKPT